MTMEISRLSLA
jgi:hypothetical protein